MHSGDDVVEAPGRFLEATQAVAPFVVHNGDFGQVNYDLHRVTEVEWESTKAEIVACANAMESFAIPFAERVADDPIGFQETAPVFIATLNFMIPAIYFLRMTQGSRYSSVLKLFNIWNNRVAANALAPLLHGMQQMVAEANNPLQPI
jgi:hypothetical protein